jgi:hypothetical protein
VPSGVSSSTTGTPPSSLPSASTFGAEGLRFGDPSDVATSLSGVPLLVECKRPTSSAALAKRLQEGFRQMSEHRRAGFTGIGAIAIDASIVANPHFGVIVSNDVPTVLYGHLQRVLSEAKVYIARAARNSRSDAGVQLLMLRLSPWLATAKVLHKLLRSGISILWSRSIPPPLSCYIGR